MTKTFRSSRRCKIVGAELATQARDLSLKIYKAGRDYARQRGIIIADTKFEFGLFDGKLILIDEVLTPDSSRFWPADQYAPGHGQPSFDKQFVRDYLETLRLEQNPARPETAGRRRRQNQREVSGSLRAADGQETVTE